MATWNRSANGWASPRLAVVDVSRLADCRLPQRPARAAGLLLDQVTDERDFVRWQTVLEPLWGIPVVGGLESLPSLRSAIARLNPGDTISRDHCRVLGNSLLHYSSAARLVHLASQGDFASAQSDDVAASEPFDRALCGMRIAVAYDDVFHCYFPDAMDDLDCAAHGGKISRRSATKRCHPIPTSWPSVAVIRSDLRPSCCRINV